jgi:outer membrane beta-barrel protein
MGGWYAGDISDGAPTYGGAYTFHFTEDLGLEAGYMRSRERFALLNAIIDRQQGLVGLVRAEDNPVQFFTGNVVWSLAYGKVRWMGGAIGRYDFYLALGGGATVEPGDIGLTGSGGFGMKFYLTQWLALRLDVRDLVHEQKRVALGVEKIVNDITATGGLSVFIPFTNERAAHERSVQRLLGGVHDAAAFGARARVGAPAGRLHHQLLGAHSRQRRDGLRAGGRRLRRDARRRALCQLPDQSQGRYGGRRGLRGGVRRLRRLRLRLGRALSPHPAGSAGRRLCARGFQGRPTPT